MEQVAIRLIVQAVDRTNRPRSARTGRPSRRSALFPAAARSGVEVGPPPATCGGLGLGGRSSRSCAWTRRRSARVEEDRGQRARRTRRPGRPSFETRRPGAGDDRRGDDGAGAGPWRSCPAAASEVRPAKSLRVTEPRSEILPSALRLREPPRPREHDGAAWLDEPTAATWCAAAGGDRSLARSRCTRLPGRAWTRQTPATARKGEHDEAARSNSASLAVINVVVLLAAW